MKYSAVHSTTKETQSLRVQKITRVEYGDELKKIMSPYPRDKESETNIVDSLYLTVNLNEEND